MAAESAVLSAIQSLGRLKSSEARFSHITREQLDQIESLLLQLQAISKIADVRQYEDDWIRNWVGKTREAVYAAAELLDIFAIEITSRNKLFFSRMPPEKILGILNDVQSKISSQETDWKTCSIWSVDRNERNFVGLDQDIEGLVVQLVNEGANYHRVISIIGSTGIGKTALARRIYNHEKIRGCFNAFSWAVISEKWQLGEVFQRILRKLVPEKTEYIVALENITELRNELFDVLETKKCLIVLDDVYQTDIWDSLKHAFLNFKSSSKLLITTGNKEISLHMGEDICYLYEQRYLNEEESWELFQRKVSPLINIPGENEYTSESIIRFRWCNSVVEEDEFMDCLDSPVSEDRIEVENEHFSGSDLHSATLRSFSFLTCNSFVGDDDFLDSLDEPFSGDGTEVQLGPHSSFSLILMLHFFIRELIYTSREVGGTIGAVSASL